MGEISAERVCKVLQGMILLDMHEKLENGIIVANPEFASKVYMWCHVVEGETCKNPHEDWVQKFLEMEIEILNAMKSPAEKKRTRNGTMRTASILIDIHNIRCGACKNLVDELAHECKICNAKFDRVASNHVGLANKLRKKRGEKLLERDTSDDKMPELVGC